MKTIYSLFISFIFCVSFTINAQIEVKTVNPDGTPNSNCYFSTDSVQVGLTNRKGSIFIDKNFKGKEFYVKELETGWEGYFVLKGDTTIVLEDIQILSEVDIKPRNTKKLYKAIMELNQSRLPEKLNLKGELFMCELYTINDMKSGSKDTVVDFFKCDIIIMDAFGSKTILAKNPSRYREEDSENVEYLRKMEQISAPLNSFRSAVDKLLKFERFEMKKFRKFKSTYNIEDGMRALKFSKGESSPLILGSNSEEYLYMWDKEDSLLNIVSCYNEQLDEGSSVAFSVPFAFTEFSNYNHDYSESHLLTEIEITLYSKENGMSAKNNGFSYFYIENKVEDDVNAKDYKEVDSLQDLFLETEQKGTKDDFKLTLYPLKFPSSIFF